MSTSFAQITSHKSCLGENEHLSNQDDIATGTNRDHSDAATSQNKENSPISVLGSSSASSSYSDEIGRAKESGKLDILSEEFDPLAALYCKDISAIKNIVPDAPVLDNVEVFAARYYKKSSQREKANTGKEKENASQGATKYQDNTSLPQRNFTAEQMPIEGKSRDFTNVVKFMTKQSNNVGPMAILQNCVDTERRIKIFIRGILKFR